MIRQNIQNLKEVLANGEMGVNVSPEFQAMIDNESLSLNDLIKGYKNDSGKRSKINTECREILKKLEDNPEYKLTQDEIDTLNQYSGAGGTDVESESSYYTPEYLADDLWNLVDGLDENSKILDPSAGGGIFLKTCPFDTKNFTQIEINKTSAEVNSLTTGNEVILDSFEEASKEIEYDSLDAVITNVPFMDRKLELDTDSYFKDVGRLEDYFIIKSLQLLKPTKRAYFILPHGVIDGKKDKVKKLILKQGSFIGAIRLPNKVFSETGANVVTDIAIFEKHPQNVLDAIKRGLVLDGSLNTVIYENKINNEFLTGKYFKQSGKKSLIGAMVEKDEFINSRFAKNKDGKTSYNVKTGMQVFSTDDMEAIKQRIAKLTKTKWQNTTEYNLLTLSDGYNIASEEALQILGQNDSLVAFFRDYVAKDTIIKSDITKFRENFYELNKSNNGQVLYGKRLFKDKMIITSMAINFYEDDKKAIDFLNALSQVLTMAKVEKITNDDIKALSKINVYLNILSNEKNEAKFKYSSKLIAHAKEYNSDIKIYTQRVRAFIISVWDTDNNQKRDIDITLDNISTVSFNDVLYAMGVEVEYDEVEDLQYIEASQVPPKTILSNDDIVLIPDSKRVTSFRELIPHGTTFASAKKMLQDIQYSPEYGLSETEFELKKEKQLHYLEQFKKEASVDKLYITNANIDYVTTREVKLLVDEIGFGLSKETLLQVPYITGRDNFDFRRFNTTVGVKSFTRADYSDDMKKLEPYFDEYIKPILDRSTIKVYNEIDNATTLYKTVAYWEKAGEENKWKNLFYTIKSGLEKIKIDVLREFNIKFDLACKQNPTVKKNIHDTINKDSRVGMGNSMTGKAGTIHSLKAVMEDSIVERNHGFQNEDINRFSDTQTGIIASGTGLGKTAIITGVMMKSLLTNKSKRVMLVVPTGVYPKWKAELIKGRFDKGGVKLQEPYIKPDKQHLVKFVETETIATDYKEFLRDKKARILVISFAQLEGFIFRKETIDKFMGDTDADIEAQGGVVINPSLIPEFKSKDWATLMKTPKKIVGYFEDSNIDLAIYDEAQYTKNSTQGGRSMKFASSISSSGIGVKSRFISAYIQHEKRKGRPQGTILSTATPFTNTPYEVFATLKKLGELRDVRDYKEFEKLFMNVQVEEYPMATQPDKLVVSKVFRGLRSLDYLERAGLDTISYRTAEAEAERPINNIDKTKLKPNTDENITNLDTNLLIKYKRDEYVRDYEIAKEYRKAKDDGVTDLKSLDYFVNKGIIGEYKIVKNDKGEDRIIFANLDDELIVSRLSSPFSLISKIGNLSIGSDFADGIVHFNVAGLSKMDIEKLTKTLLKAEIETKTMATVVEDGELVDKEVTTKKTIQEILDTKRIPLIDIDSILTLPTTDSSIVKTTIDFLDERGYRDVLSIQDFPKYQALVQNITEEMSKNVNAKQVCCMLSKSGAKIFQKLLIDHYKNTMIDALVISSEDIK